ncbi:hypothetical protein C8J56DRAFT_1044650 [Mycena floridula]|nr:hypothetical protein C8J56DRAFT_1044650 [Mycena floridula]
MSSRPTLPSLSSLDLLPRKPYDSTRTYERSRQCSVSSTLSRTPSPTPSCLSTSSSRSETAFRLVPSTLDDATAIILVRSLKEQPLLLVGPSVERYRQPQRPLAKGARIHPYRLIPNIGSRRSSAAFPSPL